MSVKIALLANWSADLQRLAADLPSSAAALQISTVTGDVNAMAGELLKARPDIAIAQVDMLADADIGLLEATIRNLPTTSLILLTPERSPEFLLKVMRAGIREVVPLPLVNGELKEVFARQLDRMSAVKDRSVGAQTFAFLPAKGGSGATFLATNLAYSLAERGKRVAVIDLNLHFGDAFMFLTEQRPMATLADVCRQIDRADGDFLRASMTQVAERLWVLPAPDSPEKALEVRPEAVERILALARTQFDFVILDIGRAIESVGVKALDTCDAIYLVMQYTVPCIHDAKRLLMMMMALGYSREKVHLIANRHQKGTDITPDDVQKALGTIIERQIPNSYANVTHSANHGVPLARHAPRDPVNRALQEWAKSVAPSEQRRTGWFAGLRRG
ncbi:MAG: AAA family ATPase [Pseudomonadota bacterium]|nr:AAA family ATPase [Pseudomonadota bacterium]